MSVRLGLALAILVAALLPAPVRAGRLALAVDRIDGPALQASDLRLQVDEASGEVVVEAARLAVPALRWSGDALAWRCQLQQRGEESGCAGPLRSAGLAGELAVRADPQQIGLAFIGSAARIDLTVPRNAGPVHIQVQRLPLVPLQEALSAWLPAGMRLLGGDVDADLHWTPGERVDGRFAVADLGLEDAARAFGIEELDGHGQAEVEWIDGRMRARAQVGFVDGTLSGGGERIRLADAPADLELALQEGADGRWEIDRFRWGDADGLVATGSASLDPAAPVPLVRLALDVEGARLPGAVQRYGRSAWSAAGLDRLQVTGAVRASLRAEEGRLAGFAVDLDGVTVRDGTAAALQNLHGRLAWAGQGESAVSRLGWTSATVAGVGIGRGSVALHLRPDGLALAQPARLAVLGGTVVLDRLDIDLRENGGPWLQARFAASGLGYDSADGLYAAAGLGVGGALQLEGPVTQPRLRVDARIEGGEVLAGAVYVRFPSTPVAVGLDAELADDRIDVHALDWRDPGVLDVHARARIALGEVPGVAALELDLRQVELAPALARYAQSALAAKGYGEIAADGVLSGHLAFGADGLERLDFAARSVTLHDGGGRFAVTGLDGGIDWRHRADRPPTALQWRSMELLQIPLGGASARFESRRGRLALVEGIGIDVLGGQIRLERLDLLPRSPRGERYSASFAIAAIEMAQLSKVFGWPSFPGNLSGGIPEVVLAGDTVELRGGLDLYVFDGYLGLSGLRLERPFGVAPSLAADIHFQNFDLEQVTSAFSLGGMTGRLDGTIADLRLVDWGLVGFDAWLRTKGGGRMSYKAVNDVASLGGGGGLTANLQTMALQLFDTFGYRRFGIRCRLQAEVCTMAGIEPASAPVGSAGDGYTIVEGAGLPRISIVGHRRRVDWPVLVERIREATSGQGPIIE